MDTATPFQQEDDSQFASRPRFDPSVQPRTPAWYEGLTGWDETGFPKAFDLLDRAVGSGVAKGASVLGGVLRATAGTNFADAPPGESIQESINTRPTDNAVSRFGTRLEQQARAQAKALTPDATTVGAAGQILHSLASSGTEMAIGMLAGGPLGPLAAVGAGEGKSRYDDLIAAGVDPETAREAAGISGVAAGLGTIVPGGIGSSLVSRIATGAIGNTAFGMANRYMDHRVLDNAGYTAMAEQQKVIDGTQIITDLILGAGFGVAAHLHAGEIVRELQDVPGAKDAALTANLANKDRQAAPGIPTDPAAANAHQEAMESSLTSMMKGEPVDVSDSRIMDHEFLKREDDPEAATMLHEQADLFGGKRALDEAIEPPAPEETKPPKYVEPAETTEPTETTEPAEKPAAAVPTAEEEPAAKAMRQNAEQVLADKPDLKILNDNGEPVKASDELQSARDDLAKTEQESKTAVQAAIQCFMRRGN